MALNIKAAGHRNQHGANSGGMAASYGGGGSIMAAAAAAYGMKHSIKALAANRWRGNQWHQRHGA